MKNQYPLIFKCFPFPGLLLSADVPDFTVVDVNEAYLELSGKNESEIIGRSFFQSFVSDGEDLNADVVSNLLPSLVTAVSTCKPGKISGQQFLVRVRGSDKILTRYFDFQNIPIADKAGNVSIILHSVIDVTQKKFSGQKEIGYMGQHDDGGLSSQNLVGFYQTTIDGLILHCNDAFAKMLKYDSPKELLSRSASDLYFSLAQRNRFITDVINQKNLYSNEGILKCKDGSPLYFLENTSLRYDAETNKQICDGIIIDISKRKLAELRLKESNERFAYVSKATFDTIWDWDVKTGRLYLGTGFKELFGYESDKQAMQFATWSDHIHPEDKDRVVKSRLNKITTDELSWKDDYRYIRADNSVAYVSDRGILLKDSTATYRMIGAMQDITEKKELEILLDKSNRLACIGSWEVDLVKGTLYWSDITKVIHDVKQDFIPDLQTAINFYKEGISRDLITEKVHDAIERGSSYDLELQIITANGSEKWIRTIGESELVNGRCIRTYGSFQDIDVRKRNELAVIEILNEKNTILESIDDAFFAVDKNWTVTYWNKQAEKVLGKPRFEMLGHNLWEVYPDRVDKESYKRYHEAVETRLAVHFEDFFDTLGKWYAISAYPSDNGLSVYFKDVTDRKISDIRLNELNENLQQQAKELALSNEELERFAYAASHDLQEPLRMVTGFLTQLEKVYGDVIDDKGKQYIAYAVDGAKRMRRIILGLLEYSRVGRTEDEKEEIDVMELIREIQILVGKQIEDKNAVISVEKLPVINTYKAPLRQVFQNLISNALKYTVDNTPSRIRISCEELKSHWQFEVADNGIGIRQEYHDKIFIIFQRLHNRDEFSGTGIGLAVSKKIIDNIGGKIWLKSEEGKGSSFYFTVLKN